MTKIIPEEYIGAVIGSGGKVIQELQKETNTTIVINEDLVGIDKVIATIEAVMFNCVYEVKVIKMLDFGAVVNYTVVPDTEVLLHVSELARERTENVSDAVNMGDIFDLKYFGIDPKTRKEKVSRKVILPKPEGWQPRPKRDNNHRGGNYNRRDNSRRNNHNRDHNREDRKPIEDKNED